jgi:hypothetical protein
VTTNTGPWTSIIEELERAVKIRGNQSIMFPQDHNQPGNITMTAGMNEMLRVAQDGFYVRGVKVPVDDKEAETVYNAFKQFLVWAELHRS